MSLSDKIVDWPKTVTKAYREDDVKEAVKELKKALCNNTIFHDIIRIPELPMCNEEYICKQCAKIDEIFGDKLINQLNLEDKK